LNNASTIFSRFLRLCHLLDTPGALADKWLGWSNLAADDRLIGAAASAPE
jgi:hypothetical protein